MSTSDQEFARIREKVLRLERRVSGEGFASSTINTETGSVSGSNFNLYGSDCYIDTFVSGGNIYISSSAKPITGSANITTAPAPIQIVGNPNTTFLWHADNGNLATASTNDGYAANCTGGFQQQPLVSQQSAHSYISTANPKFGQSSFFFDGDTAGYSPPSVFLATGSLVTSGSGFIGLRPDLTGFQGSSGTFTLEGWFYPDFASDTIGTLRTLWHINQSNALNYGLYVGAVKANISNQLYLSVDNGVGNSFGTTPVGSFVNNSWNHVAIVRSFTEMTVYINGVNYLTGTSPNLYNADQVQLGGYASANQYVWKGYADEIRISNGTAVYTFSFTPPTAAFGNYFTSSNNNCLDQVSLNNNINLTSITASGGFIGNLYGTASQANGLAGTGSDAYGSYIRVRQGDYLGNPVGVKIKYNTFDQNSAGGRGFQIEGADAYSFPNPLDGGQITIQGGKGNTQPVVNNGAGGNAYLLGGEAAGSAAGGQAHVQGGYSANGAGGDTYIRGGNPNAGQNGGDVFIIGGENFFQNAVGGDITLRAGDGTTDGVINIGLTTTNKINIGAASIPTEVYGSLTGSVISASTNIIAPTITGSQISSSNFIGWANGTIKPYGYFFNSGSLTASATNTAYTATLPNLGKSLGVSVSNSSRINFSYAGTYNIQFSAQASKGAGSSVQELYLWFQETGSNIADSAFHQHIKDSNANAVIAGNFLRTLASGSYIEMLYQTTDTDISLKGQPAAGNIPAIPSLIITVSQV